MDNGHNRHLTPDNEARCDTLGIIAMVLGITGLIFSFCCTFMAVIPGLAALLCGIIAKNNRQKYGMTGITLGVVTIITAIVLTFTGLR